MKSAIYKYQIEWKNHNEISIPKNSEFLSMHVQNNQPTLWYKHNPLYNECVTVKITMRPTGANFIDELFEGEDYITTLFIGKEVYHFFFSH